MKKAEIEVISAFCINEPKYNCFDLKLIRKNAGYFNRIFASKNEVWELLLSITVVKMVSKKGGVISVFASDATWR